MADYKEAVYIEDLGKNLFRIGGILTSAQTKISREEILTDNGQIKVRTEFQDYFVDVYVTESGKKRTFVKWERVSK